MTGAARPCSRSEFFSNPPSFCSNADLHRVTAWASPLASRRRGRGVWGGPGQDRFWLLKESEVGQAGQGVAEGVAELQSQVLL